MADEKENEQPIIIKKVKKGGGGHHGGAWKVAYADFVTAMMAFFLLLWLLNVTTSEEKTAISNYFDPTHPKISQSESGSGGVLGGMSVSPDGAMVTNVQPITNPPPVPQQQKTQSGQQESGEDKIDGREVDLEAMTELEKQNLEKQLQEVENERFKEAMQQIQEEIQKNPELAKLSDHLLMDITPEGLRIQIVDQEGRSMFAIGSAEMFPFMKELIGKVADVIETLPNQISIRGHTDGVQYAPGATYNNWDLSADRAQSSRRALTEFGFPVERIQNVVGKADREHLIPEDPLSPQNRRISLILLRDRLTREESITVDELKQKIQQGGQVLPSRPQDARDVIITRPEGTAPQNDTQSQPPSENGNTNDQPAKRDIQRENRGETIILETPPAQPQRAPKVLEFP